MKRLDAPSRHQHQKLTSIELFEQLSAAGSFDASYMPHPSLSIDTSLLSPTQAAAKIAQSLGNA
jgi:hypothetical protein